MSILKYDTYSHTIAPAVTIRRQRLGAPEGAQQAERVTWTIRGELVGDQSSLKTQISDLESAYEDDGGDLILYADDGVTVLHQLLNSATLHGTKVTKRPDFPAGEGAQYATYRTYEIAVQGDVIAGDAPSGTAWGEKTQSETIDAQGQYRIVVQGRYRGGGAQAAADAAKLAGHMVESEEQTEDVDRDEISYRYTYIDDASSRDVISWVESYSYEPQITRKVFHTLLGGGDPVRQNTVVTPARATQEGEAVGRSQYPGAPTPEHPNDLVEPRQIRKSAPRRTQDGQLTEYKISWRYAFGFTSDPTWGAPNNPPT